MNDRYDDLINEAESIVNEENASSKQKLLDEADDIINGVLDSEYGGLNELDAQFSESEKRIKKKMSQVFVAQLKEITKALDELKELAAYMDVLGITKEDMAIYGKDIEGVFQRIQRVDLQQKYQNQLAKEKAASAVKQLVNQLAPGLEIPEDQLMKILGEQFAKLQTQKTGEVKENYTIKINPRENDINEEETPLNSELNQDSNFDDFDNPEEEHHKHR